MAIEPVTREERFLAAAGGRSVIPPTPITRKEQLLQGIIDAVKSGGATPDVIMGAVNDYLNANPVQPGATTEQATQIEQNKTNIADLQAEIENKQPKGDYVKTVNGNKPDASGNVVVAAGGNGSGENPSVGGLTAEEKSLMLSLFNNALYGADIGAVKARLNALWGESGGDSGGGDSGGTDPGTLYTISTNFVNVSIDNTATSATANSAFNATLTPTTGELASVTITMGGVDVTADVYADGVIAIPAVTGNIVITASATAFVNLLADVEWRAGTGADTAAGMTYNAKATEDIYFPAGTYYFYDVYKTAAGGTPTFYAPNGDGTYTALVKGTDYTAVDNNGAFKNGTYDEYNNEKSSTYQPNGAGYLVENTVVFLRDVTVRIECISAMLTLSEPGYSWCFTQPYNPHKDVLGWEVE